MNLCISCEYCLVRRQRMRSLLWFGPVATLEHPSLCCHPNFLDPVTGAPKYECQLLRDNSMPCGPYAALYQPKGSPDHE